MLDAAIYVCAALVLVGCICLGYLGVGGGFHNQRMLALKITYATLFLVLTGGFLYFYQKLRVDLERPDSADQVTKPRPELHGLLIPANDPRPGYPLPAEIGDDAVVVFLGDSRLITKGKVTGIEVMGQKLISVTTGAEGAIAISARVISPANKVVAQITENEFYVNPDNFFRMRRDDWHTLEVVDQVGNQVLYVRYLNPTTIKVLGSFYIPNQPPTIIAEDHFIAGGMEFREMDMAFNAGTGISVNTPASPTPASPTPAPTPKRKRTRAKKK